MWLCRDVSERPWEYSWADSERRSQLLQAMFISETNKDLISVEPVVLYERRCWVGSE